MDISYTGSKVILEYVFVNPTKVHIHSKIKVVDSEPTKISDCPLWDNYMCNTADWKEYREMILKPVAMFENPFFKSPHKIVICELWLTMETPSALNWRYHCIKTMNRLLQDPITGKQQPTTLHEPWFGIEQEYFVVGQNGFPMGYNSKHMDLQSTHISVRNLDVERQLSDRHLISCLYAGVNITGCVREEDPSQWEFQIGPCEGESIGDHVTCARFILLRLAEIFGTIVNFNPVPSPGTKFASGGHINFSTRGMREQGGIRNLCLVNTDQTEQVENNRKIYVRIYVRKVMANCGLNERFIKHAVNLLSNSNNEQLLRLYDPTKKQKNKERLASGLWNPLINNFSWDVGRKDNTSIRIPTLVNVNGCGYFEDRRPPANLDPYAAADGLVRACIFGEFLKPEFEHLKDMNKWDDSDEK